MAQLCCYCRRQCLYCCPPARTPRRHAWTQTVGKLEYSLSNALESGDLADVQFAVEPDIFPGQRATFAAHKMILALQSDVFKAMLYGGFAKEDRIVIKDLHPEGFRGLLGYFYSGCLEVQTVFQAACTRTAAAKYLLPKLEMKCLTFINSNMTPDDVCPFLDYVFTTGEEALATSAAIMIVNRSRSVLSSEPFSCCTEATMKYVLKHAANVSEAFVLEVVYAWIQQYAERVLGLCPPKRRKLRGHEDKPIDLRPVMLPLLPELRFLALTPQEFIDGPNTWGILTDAEARAILSNIVKNGSMPMPAGFCNIRDART